MLARPHGPPRTAADRASRARAASGGRLLPRVASDEVWTFQEGDPLELVCAAPDTLRAEQVRLGRASEGHAPAFAVPAGHWQAAWPAGAFALLSCAVGPGFDFANFRLLGDDPAARRRIESAFPRLAHLL